MMAVGGWSVKLYINKEEVVAMISQTHRKPAQLQRVQKLCAHWFQSMSSRMELAKQLVATHRVLVAQRAKAKEFLKRGSYGPLIPIW